MWELALLLRCQEGRKKRKGGIINEITPFHSLSLLTCSTIFLAYLYLHLYETKLYSHNYYLLLGSTWSFFFSISFHVLRCLLDSLLKSPIFKATIGLLWYLRPSGCVILTCNLQLFSSKYMFVAFSLLEKRCLGMIMLETFSTTNRSSFIF